MSEQPKPFDIVQRRGGAATGDGVMASNGSTLVTVLDDDGKVFLRRGITGIVAGPLVERIIPVMNQLQGEMIEHAGTMTHHEVAARLHALQVLCVPDEYKNIEWAVAELDGVRAYVSDNIVYLTRADLTVGKQLT